MKIKIFLVGQGPITELETDLSIKVSALKIRVHEETGIPVDQQQLFYAGKKLNDERTLSECDLPAKSGVVTLLCMSPASVQSKSSITSPSTPEKQPTSSLVTSSPGGSPVSSQTILGSIPVPSLPAPVSTPGSPAAPSSVSDSVKQEVRNHFIDESPKIKQSVAELKDVASAVRQLLLSPNSVDQTNAPISRDIKDLLATVSARVPAAHIEVPSYNFPDPFVGLTKSVSELESPAADYAPIKKFIDIVDSRIASGNFLPYFDVLKAKFEAVYQALKPTRNQKIADMLLQRQADVNRIVKDVTDKPDIFETLADKQVLLDAKLERMQAGFRALQQLESVGFDSRAEKQLRELLPLCDEIEAIADQKMDQLDTLSEIYANFAPLSSEKQDTIQVLSAISQERLKDRSICESDVTALKQSFSQLKDQEALRSMALVEQINSAVKREGDLDSEDRLIGALMSHLLDRFESNQAERRRLHASRQVAEKEKTARAQLLSDASEEVEHHLARLHQTISDLTAASEAVSAFMVGTLNEIDQLDKITAIRHADFKKAYLQALKEKYETTVHHYRVIFKKIHALKNFKNISQKMIAEMQVNLRRWSELKRATMVDKVAEQLATSEVELRASDEESAMYNAVLSRLDCAFELINAKMFELNEQPLLHPGLDIEAECLEQDRKRLELEAAAISDNSSSVQDELRLVNSRIESANLRRASSQFAASGVAPRNADLATSRDMSSSFVEVPNPE